MVHSYFCRSRTYYSWPNYSLELLLYIASSNVLCSYNLIQSSVLPGLNCWSELLGTALRLLVLISGGEEVE